MFSKMRRSYKRHLAVISPSAERCGALGPQPAATAFAPTHHAAVTARARADSIGSIGGSVSESVSSFDLGCSALERFKRTADGRCGTSADATRWTWSGIEITCLARPTRRRKPLRRGRRSGSHSNDRRTKEGDDVRHLRMAGRAAGRHHQMDGHRCRRWFIVHHCDRVIGRSASGTSRPTAGGKRGNAHT